MMGRGADCEVVGRLGDTEVERKRRRGRANAAVRRAPGDIFFSGEGLIKLMVDLRAAQRDTYGCHFRDHTSHMGAASCWLLHFKESQPR